MEGGMAKHELYLLHLGQLGSVSADTGQTHYSQVPGYLIRTAAGRTVLVDTGNPARMIGQLTAAPWMTLLNETKPEDDIVPRLAELGHRPADIDLLITTHFDFDHCGRHDAFAKIGAEVIVQRTHVASAKADTDRYDPALWDLPGLRYTLVDGDVELEPGLTLLETSGHALGHQSLMVDTDDGPVILAADAISESGMTRSRVAPEGYPDRAAAIRSMDRLLTLAQTTGAYLIMGHEGSQWRTLPKSPVPFARPQ
jgi:N-acyl homoserine lactone hydrolase